jgi:heme A synthase
LLIFFRKINRISFPIGLTACLGMSMVANFQETSVLVVHYTGAILSFGVGTAYFWLQAVVSYELAPHLNTRRKAHFRIALASVSTLSFLVAIVCGVLARKYYHGTDPLKWYPKDGGWGLHVTSTGAEWVMALCFDAFVASFIGEFKRLIARPPEFFLDVRHFGLGQSLDRQPINVC